MVGSTRRVVLVFFVLAYGGAGARDAEAEVRVLDDVAVRESLGGACGASRSRAVLGDQRNAVWSNGRPSDA